MNTSHCAVMRYRWGSKAGLHSIRGRQVKLCDTSLTRAIRSALEMSIGLLMTRRYTSALSQSYFLDFGAWLRGSRG